MTKLLPILLVCILYIHITSGFTYNEITAKSIREQQHIKKSSIDYPSDIIDGNVELPLSVPYIQWSASRRRIFNRRYCCIVLKATSDDGSDKGGGGGKKGYRFGDFTKGITKSLIGDKVEKITGKPYEFGDLSRTIDSSIKDKINDVTGNDEYEFGDLSRLVDSKIKDKVNDMTGSDEYKFGDLTKEIVRRVASGSYTLDDLFMLLKAMSLVGASLSPVAGFLPVKLLVELLNFSLMNDIAGKVTSSLAIELDKRLKQSLLGDADYKLGDATKRTIANAVEGYIGKEYEFGDITKKVVDTFAEETKVIPKDKATIGSKDMEANMVEALDSWDKLSENELQDGLDKIEQYVELVEKEQRGEEKK